MFVKKLVDKASKKPASGNLAEDVDPRLVFHYGIPTGSVLLAYDSIQKILAISTKDGRIKLLGKDNAQALLESRETVASKYLQFIENQGILLNVTTTNHIEVWDVDRRLLSYIHVFKEEITSFTVLQHSLYMYVGDSVGNVSVLKVDQDPCRIIQMKYNIPLSASRGITNEATGDTAIMHILPQPAAESKRVLIIFRDGFMTLWVIRGSKSIFTAGGSTLQSLNHEAKKVSSACWACPFGSKVVVGYSNGDIFIWNVCSKSESATDKELSGTQSTPACKLNLGYKLDRIPIASLKWVYADGKASRLYVMGASDSVSANLLQVILLNDQTESRTIKLALHPSEACLDMAVISSTSEQNKNKPDSFLLLGKSGRIYMYDDILIEKYLLQCQSRSSPSLPKEVMVKLPFADSRITTAKFITENTCLLSSTDEDYVMLAKNIQPLLPFDVKPKEGTQLNSVHFGGFTKIKNLYITGHSNGAINFWDLSCPILLPVLSLKQQSEEDFSLSGIALTALYFDSNPRLLVSGDQNGMVRIYKFKPEASGIANSLMSLQGITKKGSNNIIQSIKLIKVNGAILCLNMSRKHLAVGSDQGHVSLIDIEGHTIIYQRHIPSELCPGIISLQFETCSFHGFEKNALLVATRDSSVLALEGDMGNTLSSSTVHPKKPSKALFMQILDGRGTGDKGSNISEGLDMSKSSGQDVLLKQSSLLLCSEKAAYVYSLMHVVQGVKKVQYKKKFHSSSCCWASTFNFNTPPNSCLILIYTSGKIEIRSLPELLLLKESTIRGLTFSSPKQNSFSDISICSSWSGELIVVNSDQEIFFVSVLLQKEVYRLLDSVCQVYKNDLAVSEEGLISVPPVPKEKKKGLFSSFIKDIRGSKAKHGPETEAAEDVKDSIEELSTIFSTANFPFDNENKVEQTLDEVEDDLDIDDIDLEDPEENSKGNNMMGALKKPNLTSKFQTLKSKLKQMKVQNEKVSVKEETQDEKAGSVDQIKKKYGFPLSGESSVAKMAGNKLNENLKKLQGISIKTTEMQDTARSFSFLAKEVLQSAEHEKQSS
ncbi:uncharacterized protein LOC131151627 [Malania oleifera]|uniref:uncharacterized protein LOC131151627 n=1 Tax=Malania oleifera TaxID=397392 RepID=UPI0025AEAFE2|nr:uncharacterized protein LOC131151627 [Malania oleifera]